MFSSALALPRHQRKRTTHWRDVIRAHMEVLAGTDFFTVEVFTLKHSLFVTDSV